MFKIGQKVVCIDFSDWGTGAINQLLKDKIYEISSVNDYGRWGVGLGILGISANSLSGEFNSKRFRLVDETFTEETCAMLNEHFESLKVTI